MNWTAPLCAGTRRTPPISPVHVDWGDMPVGPASASTEVDQLYTVVAFDPGGRTGWAVFGVHPDAMCLPDAMIMDNISFWSAGEFYGREDEMVDAMIGLVVAWPESADIVVEDFIPRPGAPVMDREVLSPIRITAAFAYGLRSTGLGRKRGRGIGRVPIIQPGALAMATITDDRLRELRLWDPLSGQAHARDAVRHALTWCRRKKDATLRTLRAAQKAAPVGSGEEE